MKNSNESNTLLLNINYIDNQILQYQNLYNQRSLSQNNPKFIYNQTYNKILHRHNRVCIIKSKIKYPHIDIIELCITKSNIHSLLHHTPLTKSTTINKTKSNILSLFHHTLLTKSTTINKIFQSIFITYKFDHQPFLSKTMYNY